ncbi:hypothetical protein SAMN05421780_10648 [Flexibacter flexilis DSM 6793]|uniref:Outer membrane protein beta-barrel domain-containing protein n=1 Tax=Flexibacter flexilis DSM 6793 TaxID=927664 RepID=A0A1I1JLL4_9BACT|nr:hypothetical protein [Flexibacter flexilis]SFC49467.1 hypothetical protein SAMN05421780_10648 [Flexibacter flexilis DSM 6793]
MSYRYVKCILCGLLAFLPMSVLFAQNASDTIYVAEQDSILHEEVALSRWYKGGNLTVRVGDPTYIDVSPLLGYRFSAKLSAGVGLTYMYYSQGTGAKKETSSVLGGRLFSRYYFMQTLFGHAEYETLRSPYYNESQQTYRYKWVGAPMLGLGYSLPVSDGAAITFVGLYNLNFKPTYSPYNSSFVVRAGFVF